jgi:hypothetical protein
MNAHKQKTAKIYAFPVRKKSNANPRLSELEAEARKYSAPEYGSGWYHDAAIDANKVRGRR